MLILSCVIFIALLFEIAASSLVLGHLAPEYIPNLFLAIGFALALVPLFRGSYTLAAGLGIFVALAGISWTRYVSTGYFSADASYDFTQYVLDLILILFYANLVAQRKRHIVLTLCCSLVLLSLYAIALPHFFRSDLLPVTKSVFISGYLFLILSGFIVVFTFQQNQKAIEKAKQESDASNRSEQKYQEIFNSTNEAIFIYNASTLQLVDVNDAVLHMFGFETKDEVFDYNLGVLREGVFPFSREDAATHLNNAKERGPQIVEWHAKKKTGEYFWVEASLQRSDIGGKSRILTVVRDITERKHEQERTRTVEFSINQASDAIFWMNRNAGFVYVNEQACHSLGYTRAELLQLHLWDIDPDDRRDQWDADWAESQKDQHASPHRLRRCTAARMERSFLLRFPGILFASARVKCMSVWYAISPSVNRPKRHCRRVRSYTGN